ncbi:MAG: glucosamine--fructose-6-phosphate aminotransferase, partial [Chloroflexi bacterium]|nr:glucosamine--fructose-6-phosphate aminotransferase [Chloroflexota bacterium]
ESGFPVFAISPKGKVFDSMQGTLAHLKNDLQAELIVISNSLAALELAEIAIPIPERVPEWLSPIVSIIPAQLFAYYLTLVKGYDANKPRTISKVTETR